MSPVTFEICKDDQPLNFPSVPRHSPVGRTQNQMSTILVGQYGLHGLSYLLVAFLVLIDLVILLC